MSNECSRIFNSSENWMSRKTLCESRSSNFPTPPRLDLLTACPKILSSHTRQLLDPATPLSSKHRDPSRSILWNPPRQPAGPRVPQAVAPWVPHCVTHLLGLESLESSSLQGQPWGSHLTLSSPCPQGGWIIGSHQNVHSLNCSKKNSSGDF